jgi:hypothetical protein
MTCSCGERAVSLSSAGPFASLMQTEGSVSVRSALLQAVLATRSGATLARLLAAGTCAALLATWLNVTLIS